MLIPLIGTLSCQNEMQEMKLNNSNSNASSHRWPAESYGTDTMSEGYQRPQNLHEAPLTGNC